MKGCNIMKIDYGKWFNEQYKYLTGIRDGKITYNDTKWEKLIKRYKQLVDMSSDLLNEQPFGLVGNKYGFDKLINLIGRSNYTFEDIDTGLKEAYEMSLKNTMGRMTVNTQTVLFKCNNTDSKNCTPDKFSHYYIIEAPMNQMHFGDRDEFIRQRLNKMHHTNDGYYMSMEDFLKSDIVKILGFSFLFTSNGFINNDVKIAFDDKGFKFKIGWLYSADCDFVIYKLDESLVYHSNVDSKHVISNDTNGERCIPYSALGITPCEYCYNKKCLINIFDKNFIKTIQSVPNFGIFTKKGLLIKNIQQKTIDNINRNKSKTVDVIVYAFKYFKEVPNLYPAVNYYDIIDSRLVYTDEWSKVYNYENKKVISKSINDRNTLETCTPPIVLDRPVDLSFKTIIE